MSEKAPLRRLDNKTLARLVAQRKIFEKVEKMVGVPWQALAAVWFRESSGSFEVGRPGGPFQFDPPNPHPKVLRRLLERFTKLNSIEIDRYVERGVEHFPSAVVFAACWLRLKSRPVISPTANDEAIKDAFYGYNGRSWGSADKSPYVMTGWDKERMAMRIRGTVRRKDGSNEEVDRMEDRPGAFCVYKQLCELYPREVPNEVVKVAHVRPNPIPIFPVAQAHPQVYEDLAAILTPLPPVDDADGGGEALC